MKTDKKYLLDANVFIEAHRRYYAFDVGPGFWDCLIENHKKGTIFSIDRIKEELKDYGDELSQWVLSKMPPTCFLSTDSTSVINWYGQMQTWAYTQTQFSEAAKAEFANNPDCWLIACAKANSFIVVTHEVFSQDIQRKIPIPNACQTFGIEYINTFDMIRALGVRLVLEG